MAKDQTSTWDSKPWRKFERVVAALHKFADQGADVKWNEKINGRQIDVSVRFERGGYCYLLLVECRNVGKPIEVEDVEAFVTKSRDLGANKAIMVATAGFQSGAKESAKRHGIELYTLKEQRKDWAGPRFISGMQPGIEITGGVVLWPFFGSAPIILPRHRELVMQLRFGAPNSTSGGTTLAQVVSRSKLRWDDLAETEERSFRIGFPSGVRVSAALLSPFVGAESVTIRGLQFNAKRGSVYVRSPVVGPDLPFRSYVYENVLTGKQTFFGMDLPIGLDNQFQEGRFYRNILDMSYKCEKVNGDKTEMFVFINQLGAELAARVTMETSHQSNYVEVADPAEVAKLEAAYKLWPARPESRSA